MLTCTYITGHKNEIIDIRSAGHVKVMCIYNQLFFFFAISYCLWFYERQKSIYYYPEVLPIMYMYIVYTVRKTVMKKNLLFSQCVLL